MSLQTQASLTGIFLFASLDSTVYSFLVAIPLSNRDFVSSFLSFNGCSAVFSAALSSYFYEMLLDGASSIFQNFINVWSISSMSIVHARNLLMKLLWCSRTPLFFMLATHVHSDGVNQHSNLKISILPVMFVVYVSTSMLTLQLMDSNQKTSHALSQTIPPIALILSHQLSAPHH